MNISTLCPACLTELPDNYPHDHVVIDRALSNEPERFATMRRAARREVVLTGLARGLTITALSRHLGCAGRSLRDLLPAEHPESLANARIRHAAERQQLEATIRELWEQGLPDTEISLRTGMTVYLIADIRRRLGLSTHTARSWLLPGGVR
jgi:hypothetical protein